MRLCLNPDLAPSSPTYFIADIAANHDGSLERALALIRLAAESGANAAKFQNFKAETIVSRKGFQELGRKLTHQASWKKDVYEVYQWDEQYKPETWSFDPVNIFNPNTSIYAEAYEKKENIPFQDISNLDKSVEMLAEDNFPVSIVPPNKINQYKYGRPDVICRKL